MAKPKKRGESLTSVVSVTDPVTKKRTQYRVTAATETELEKKLEKLHEDLKAGLVVDRRMTVTGFIDRTWLPGLASQVAAGELRARTYDGYEHLLRGYVLPVIGKVKLTDLNATHVQDVINGVRNQGRAPNTTRNVHRVLCAALNQAVALRLLPYSPSAGVRPPRVRRRRRGVPDVGTVGRILANARASRFYTAIVLSIFTGLRRGEVLGLRWEVIDLVKGEVKVVGSLQRVRGHVVITLPKTEESERVVALPAAAIAELKRNRAAQSERRLLAGELWEEGDLVFDSGLGGPMDPSEFSRAFKKAAIAAGAPDVRLHDARHAFATRLMEVESNPKIVSSALGHSSSSFTMDTYSDATTKMAHMAADAIERVYEGVLPDDVDVGPQDQPI